MGAISRVYVGSLAAAEARVIVNVGGRVGEVVRVNARHGTRHRARGQTLARLTPRRRSLRHCEICAGTSKDPSSVLCAAIHPPRVVTEGSTTFTVL